MRGAERPELQELPRIGERISFLYLEHCILEKHDGGLTSRNGGTITPIPISSISTLLLGPGTSISHAAIDLISDSGTVTVWVGEQGSRYYAHGRPLTHSSSLLECQARLVSNKRSRLAVARKMYAMRFPGEDVSRLSMQQLRGREGSRIRKAYRDCSMKYGVEWNGRCYKPGDPSSGDDVNAALSIANSCLYGAVQSAIVAMGCSPGLGFIHTGHERSFVYDVADLYKVEVTFPVAFESASVCGKDLYPRTRRLIRDSLVKHDIMKRVVHDVHILLKGEETVFDSDDKVFLWDEGQDNVPCGTSYGSDSNDGCRDTH